MTTATLTPVTTCRICLKRSTAQHTPATRMVHADHLTRMGWSGMCPAPSGPLAALRATLTAEGCYADPDPRLDADAERIAREDRQS